MAKFGPEIFARLANEVSFKAPSRIDYDLKPVDPGCLIKGKILPKPDDQGDLAGRRLNHEEDIHNFKEALFALVMMRARNDLLKQRGPDNPDPESATVNVVLKFSSGAVHPEAKRLKWTDDATRQKLDRSIGLGIDTIIEDIGNPPAEGDEVYNLISLFSLGYLALACN